MSYNAHRAYNVPYAESLHEFGERPIRAITAQEIDVFIKQIALKGFAKRTVKGYLSLLSLIFNFGMRNGYCDQNPTQAISVPSRLKTTKRELPEEKDIETVKNSIDKHFGFFAYFILYTGLRRGECLALEMDDINVNDRIITVNKSLYWEGNKPIIKDTKTKAGDRTVIIPDALIDKLPNKKTGYLFGDDSPMTLTAFRYHWNKYVQETGVTFTPHMLRHLYATILFECGIDEKITQELMGHSSINITRNVYTHIREQKLNETTEKLNKYINVQM